MIDGIVYNLHTNKEKIKIEISDDLNLKKSFYWVYIPVSSTRYKTIEDIKEECQRFEYRNTYEVVPDVKNNKQNCQTFVAHILKFITGWEDAHVEDHIRKLVGHGLLHALYDFIYILYLYRTNRTFPVF
jgi:hypothetical protein